MAQRLDHKPLLDQCTFVSSRTTLSAMGAMKGLEFSLQHRDPMSAFLAMEYLLERDRLTG